MDSIISAKFPETASINSHLAIQILEECAHLIAKRYVDEHYGEIVARLDQNAIARLAIADAGKKIAEEIRSSPTIIREKADPEVYQRGFFGGTKRIR